MSPLKQTLAQQAGPDALGILIPPGPRTVLILRPRSLEWDLVLLKSCANTEFREMGQPEATAIAEELFHALERWCAGGAGEVESVPVSEEDGALVWMDVDDYSLVLCARNPGKPYEPLLFKTAQEADQVAAKIKGICCPEDGRTQEIYFNSRHFS